MRARSARRAGEDAAGAARSPRPDVPGSPEDSPHRPAGATSSAFTEPACLRVDPGMEILAAVEDPAADAEATWSGAETEIFRSRVAHPSGGLTPGRRGRTWGGLAGSPGGAFAGEPVGGLGEQGRLAGQPGEPGAHVGEFLATRRQSALRSEESGG